ncbi:MULTISPECIES: paraquat-inducible protein A [Aliiglaciecola]|uniref:paraquat-inducible protein A n=1 Tax=Aliiglaciecola TaxID=1406885 RepID=UPI001C083B9C|nr:MULTISPECIES: paraquat-inducible protein A [Aliiglaciecola]MBU2878580.1 paraquat-inducible protein A [Aliiglaciecola lipolytica]MDO6709591.1 paraquat-inducible protein A [Aliiglaciecola sp. 2_MG-2023]MDO6750867.1 paraquat-inducible protein A [Aliiglaciecola sp. 1_MG-2023]
MKRHIGFALNILAIGLFFPGILLPMFSLDMEMAASLGGSTLSSSIVDKELSIMATIDELWHDQRILVAALILLFSVGIPLIKTSMVCVAYFQPGTRLERAFLSVVSSIGKWSMADVFVVAVFLAILSTNHAETTDSHNFAVFGFKMSLDISTQTLSNAGQGFYYFAGYCLLSLLGTHFAMRGAQPSKPKALM